MYKSACSFQKKSRTEQPIICMKLLADFFGPNQGVRFWVHATGSGCTRPATALLYACCCHELANKCRCVLTPCKGRIITFDCNTRFSLRQTRWNSSHLFDPRQLFFLFLPSLDNRLEMEQESNSTGRNKPSTRSSPIPMDMCFICVWRSWNACMVSVLAPFLNNLSILFHKSSKYFHSVRFLKAQSPSPCCQQIEIVRGGTAAVFAKSFRTLQFGF